MFDAFVDLFRRTRTVLMAPATPDETRPGQNARTHLLLSVVFGAGERLSRTMAALVRYQLSEDGPLLRYTALSAAPEAVRQDLAAVTRRLGDRFGQMVADGVIDGSIRAVDQGLAARMLDDMINAAAELWRWTPELDADRAVSDYARPMMFGLLSTDRA